MQISMNLYFIYFSIHKINKKIESFLKKKEQDLKQKNVNTTADLQQWFPIGIAPTKELSIII